MTASLAQAYREAVAQLQHIAASQRADAALNPDCYSQALLHGGPVDDVIVLWHGFTNCPRQFVELGSLFYARGFNVYIPLIPRHGLRDRMTDALVGLTVAELKMAALQAMRIAQGLGRNVHTSGLSLGGVLAAWLGQSASIATAMPISPFFALPWFGRPVNDTVVDLALHLPNVWVWWDPRLKEACKPDHAYPRFPTRALATVMLFGEGIFQLASAVPPLAQRGALVLNSKDPAINLNVARQFIGVWEGKAEMIQSFTFTDLDARHDIIEPTTYADAPRLVYPVLVDLLLRAEGTPMPIPRA